MGQGGLMGTTGEPCSHAGIAPEQALGRLQKP